MLKPLFTLITNKKGVHCNETRGRTPEPLRVLPEKFTLLPQITNEIPISIQKTQP